MATFIHGVGASENIDSSGEIVSIAGLDISSLDKDGVFNWEHKSDTPAQVVGKILKARKIFSDADCEDDNQLAFWNKIKVPYLYVMGELFDDYSDSAREVAGKFRYDADKKGQNERATMNFSVEGSKISKEGITVARSIARKITITVLPCNKAAVAEMVSVAPAKPKKGEIDELFKTEAVEIEILQFSKNDKMWDLLKKEDPKKHADKLGLKPFNKNSFGGQSPDQNSAAATPGGMGAIGPTSAGGLLASEDMKKAAPKLAVAKPASAAPAHARGNQIGSTSAGHGIHSHGMVGDYTHFSAKDHHEAAAAHQKLASASKDMKTHQHHANKARIHTARGTSLEVQGRKNIERKAALTAPPPRPKAPIATVSPNTTARTVFHPERSGKIKPPGPVGKSEMAKAMTAGSGLASPANLSDGAALSKEKLDKKMHKAGQSGMDPQSGNDPGTSRINKPLRSKDSRVQVLNPQSVVGKSEVIQKNASTIMSEKQDEVVDELRKDAANPKLAPKDVKVKQLQQQIDSGKYKQPDASKIADKMINHPEKPLKKSAWLQRAEADYAAWNKREAFEQFMQQRMPHLTKAEIQVIGQTMLLQKSIKQEKLLKDFYNPGTLLGKSKDQKK